MPSPPHNSANPNQRENQGRIERAKLILDSWLRDALEKLDFHGNVSIDVTIKRGRIIAAEPKIAQTILSFDETI